MPEYWITYETTATLMFRVEADTEEAAHDRWQNEAPFDLDYGDFVSGPAGSDPCEASPDRDARAGA